MHHHRKAFSLVEMLIVGTIFTLVTGVFLGGLAWPWTINTWLGWADKDPAVLWWHGSLLGFVPAVGQSWIVLTPVTWIVSLFM